MTPTLMASIAGALLLLALAGLAYALTAKPRHRDPHDGMARGCLMLVSIPILGLGATLALAYAMGWTRIVTWIFYACVIPGGFIASQLVTSLLIQRRKHARR